MEEKPVQVAKKGMPKQTIAFVTFLIVVTIVLLGLAVYTQKPSAPTPTTLQQPVSPSYAHTTLKLTPPVKSPTFLNTYSTNVTLSSNGDKVTAAQLELSFDLKVLTNVQIVPGTYIKNPVVLLKKVDQAGGRISLAIGIPLGDKSLSGTAPSQRLLLTKSQWQTANMVLDFLPKTAITAEGIAQSVLKESTGSLFFVNQVENTTPGATLIPAANK